MRGVWSRSGACALDPAGQIAPCAVVWTMLRMRKPLELAPARVPASTLPLPAPPFKLGERPRSSMWRCPAPTSRTPAQRGPSMGLKDYTHAASRIQIVPTPAAGHEAASLARGSPTRAGARGLGLGRPGPGRPQLPSGWHWHARVTSLRQLRPPSATYRVSSYLSPATHEYSKCYSRANHKYRRGLRGCAASS